MIQLSLYRRFRQTPEQIQILPHLLRWLIVAGLVGILSGSASAIFLIALEWATDFREGHRWLIALLPLGGLLSGLIYHRVGRPVEGGNDLILDQIHRPSVKIPLRMMPLVLGGTVLTHFFGGSAGREGTAIQMGASLADQLGQPFRLRPSDRRILLMAGVAAGFASVFGTPLAGAIFGLEVIALGKLHYDAIFPCFIAAIVGDQVTGAWGVQHTVYTIPAIPPIGAPGLLYAMLAGAVFGLVGMFFSRITHAVGRVFQARIAWAPLRPFVGGAIVAAATFAIGTTRYNGLGIPTILESFRHRLPPWDFLAKLAFTAITLGAGFKGGEVTPLFFIGSALGSTLSGVLPLAPALLAGMGFVAVFAGAANTPIASTLMAIELFGGHAGVFAGVACVVSYLFSGHAGIYRSQLVGRSKLRHLARHAGLSLRDLD